MKQNTSRPLLGFYSYLLWIFPFTGFFGLHWIFLSYKIHNQKLYIHNLIRALLLCIFNAVFWFTRLFVCDHRWMTAAGLIPWYDTPECNKPVPHPKPGECFGGAVTAFMMIHLIAMGLFFAFWILDALTMWIALVFVESREEEEFKGKWILVLEVIVSIFVGAAVGFVVSWILMNIIAAITHIPGDVQGIVSLILTFLITLISLMSFAIVKIQKNKKRSLM